MTTLQITVDPDIYLAVGAKGASARVRLKHALREQAQREGHDKIEIEDMRNLLVERVRTCDDIAQGRMLDGYVVGLDPKLGAYDAIQNLNAADAYGDVTTHDETRTLTVFVKYATTLGDLKNDPKFNIVSIGVVWSGPKV